MKYLIASLNVAADRARLNYDTTRSLSSNNTQATPACILAKDSICLVTEIWTTV